MLCAYASYKKKLLSPNFFEKKTKMLQNANDAEKTIYIKKDGCYESISQHPFVLIVGITTCEPPRQVHCEPRS